MVSSETVYKTKKCLVKSGKDKAREGRVEGASVLCGEHLSTLRQVLEYSPQSTILFSARRQPAFCTIPFGIHDTHGACAARRPPRGRGLGACWSRQVARHAAPCRRCRSQSVSGRFLCALRSPLPACPSGKFLWPAWPDVLSRRQANGLAAVVAVRLQVCKAKLFFVNP